MFNKTLNRKLKIEQHEPNSIRRWTHMLPLGHTVPVPLLAPVVLLMLKIWWKVMNQETTGFYCDKRMISVTLRVLVKPFTIWIEITSILYFWCFSCTKIGQEKSSKIKWKKSHTETKSIPLAHKFTTVNVPSLVIH
jgi:hypothetical protein